MCDVCGTSGGDRFKTQPGTPERVAEVEADLRQRAKDEGHQVVGVMGDSTSFCYTVGRILVDRPEMLITGRIDPRVAMVILNRLAALEDEGKVDLITLGTGEPVDVPDFPVKLRFVQCDPEASEMNSSINLAISEGKGLIAYQVIWPDNEGHWPEDLEFEAGPQPIYALEGS